MNIRPAVAPFVRDAPLNRSGLGRSAVR